MTTTALPHLSLFPALEGVSNPALAPALRSLPDYDQNQAGKQRIATELQSANAALLAAVHDRMEVVHQAVATAQADKPQPRALPRQAAKSAAALAEARELVAVLQEADKLLAEGRDRLLTTAPDALLRHLGGQLQAALAEARACGLDESVATADEAIDAGQVDAWKTVTRLAAVASDIRAAQRLVWAHLVRGSDLQQHLDSFGQVRNYVDLFPEWLGRQRGKAISTFNGEPVYPTPPWDENTLDDLWAYAVRHHEVDLWVPTPAELRDTYAQAHADVLRVEALEDAEAAGQPLTPDQKQWRASRNQLMRLHERHALPTIK